MVSDNPDIRHYLMALTAMNVRLMAEIAAMAKTPEKARETMFYFEKSIIDDIGKLTITLRPGETDEDLDRVRQAARDLVASLLSGQRFL